eukprot:gnl/MRDRNA2_/MRDRNA2_95459_c0_seq1.p1 gnl/MRDRNA2_/MRDRNA2_95459_c0~~gnl/MRDRNA2_/MRDRNA2_95459_c0_seq1.p1  ORF type:complete len:290 (+),score=54.34 gnl/MRDRNA2_/MRDRNA2_95459_c0_seq1:125-994(+)
MSATDCWVCCDACDKWRLLSARCYEQVKDDPEFFCDQIHECACDDEQDDTEQNTMYWSKRGGRLLKTFLKSRFATAKLMPMTMISKGTMMNASKKAPKQTEPKKTVKTEARKQTQPKKTVKKEEAPKKRKIDLETWLWRSLSRHHPGKLEVDWQSEYWADHDEGCHGPIDTNANRQEFPDGFRWSCCDKLGDEDGCVSGEGEPLISTPQKVSRRRIMNVDLNAATPPCFSKGDGAETLADNELSSIAPDLVTLRNVAEQPHNISRDVDAFSHGKSYPHHALCQDSTKCK